MCPEHATTEELDVTDDHTTATAPAPLAFIDTETDGIHPGRQVWEVAIVRRDPDGTEDAWERFVDIDLSTADPFGLRVGRFYDRHPKGRALSRQGSREAAPTSSGPAGTSMRRDHAARRIAQLTHGAHLVGAVPNFDAEVLDRLLREHRLIPAWHYHLVDVENLAVGHLAATGSPIRPPWSSTELTTALGVEPATEEERHTAMGDVRWAMRMYDHILGSGAE